MNVKNEEITVNLITIHDKADTETINDHELKALIKVFYKEQS